MSDSVHPPSVWSATANSRPALTRLERDIETEVVIIGGGYSGLSTAHHLSKDGIGSVVLEANDVGWGASGRNGGMAVLRYKKSYSMLVSTYGVKVTRRLYELILEAVDTIESIVEEYEIDCGYQRSGHITAASSLKSIRALEADVRWLASEVGDRTPVIIDHPQMQALTGTSVYTGGYLDPRAAEVHPLNYTRGLASGLTRKGVPIYVRSPATGVRKEDKHVLVSTPAGSVRADKVVFATNAYTDLERLGVNLHRRIVPVSSSVIATAPLPEDVAAAVLPSRRLVTDTRRLTNYFRKLPGNRIVFGGRGEITGSESPKIYRGLEQRIAETFPVLAGAPIEFRWSGKVAITLDDFPHLGCINDRFFFGMGCGGRGVALTNLLGKLLARMVKGETIDAGPMNGNRFNPIPMHGWRIPAMQMVAGYYALLDCWDRYETRAHRTVERADPNGTF